MAIKYGNDEVLKRIGEAVRRLRLRKKMTQERAADRAGMSRERWSKLEHGHRNVTLVTLHQAATAVGSSLGILVTEAFPEEADEMLAAIREFKKGKLVAPEKLRAGRKKKKKVRPR